MKDYLELEGFDVKSPRSAIQTAFQSQLVTGIGLYSPGDSKISGNTEGHDLWVKVKRKL